VLPHGAKEISFFFMVHPDPSSTEQPTLEMEVLKNNEPIAQCRCSYEKPMGRLHSISGINPVLFFAKW
jgi:hypothetical protein